MRVWVTLVASALLLAGCAESSGPVDDQEEFSEDLSKELKATKDTGVIRGVVVDSAIVPVPGATVRLTAAGKETMSNEKGEFGFADLAPGTYFLSAEKIGFLNVQQSVEVQAGNDAPPIVKVLLERDVTYNPYYDLLHYRGYYQCGTSAVVICAAPNILFGMGTTDDSSTPTFYWDITPDFVQTEMVWESTQAISTQLYFEMEALDSGCDGSRGFLGNAEGDSPIRTRVNATILEESDIGGDDCGIYYSIFAGDFTNGVVPPWGLGFAIEQDFEWFITSFYSYEPPEEWWFIEDGAYPPPA